MKIHLHKLIIEQKLGGFLHFIRDNPLTAQEAFLRRSRMFRGCVLVQLTILFCTVGEQNYSDGRQYKNPLLTLFSTSVLISVLVGAAFAYYIANYD